MAEYNAPGNLVTPGGTIAFNGDVNPKLLHDATLCSGLDGAPIRATTEDKPVTDGGIPHRQFLSSREITLGGAFVVDSIPQRNTAEKALLDALESIREDPTITGTYEWTPDGMTLHSVTVRCDVALVCSLRSDGLQGYQFGLVAVDPTITIA